MIRRFQPFFLLLPLLLIGCVSKGRMELTEIQLEATRTALHARDAANQQRIRDLEDDLRQQQQRLRHARMVAGDVRANMEVLQERLETVQQTEARLLEALAAFEREQAEREALEERRPPVEPTDEEAAPVVITPSGPAHERIATALGALDDAVESTRRVERHFEQIEAALGPLAEAGRLTLIRDEDALVVRIGVHVLFQEHRVLLSPLGEQVLAEMAEALTEISGRRLLIEGHTDPHPHHSVQFASNWELGFGRAMTVLRALDGHGLNIPAFAASHAGQRPLRDGDSAQARQANERVELRFTLRPPREPVADPEASEQPEEDAPDATEQAPDAEEQAPASPTKGDDGA